MREIKFRIFDTMKKTMFYPAPFKYLKRNPNCLTSSGFLISLLGKLVFYEYDKYEPGGMMCTEGNLVLMQFTSLHDKNGKEIYESDIIKFTFKNDSGWLKANGEPELGRWGVVGSESAYFALYENNDKTAYYVLDFVEEWGVEIIGNIYENPELLEKK